MTTNPVSLDARMAIQGLLAERDGEMRVYVVTIDALLNMPGFMTAGRDWFD